LDEEEEKEEKEFKFELWKEATNSKLLAFEFNGVKEYECRLLLLMNELLFLRESLVSSEYG